MIPPNISLWNIWLSFPSAFFYCYLACSGGVAALKTAWHSFSVCLLGSLALPFCGIVKERWRSILCCLLKGRETEALMLASQMVVFVAMLSSVKCSLARLLWTNLESDLSQSMCISYRGLGWAGRNSHLPAWDPDCSASILWLVFEPPSLFSRLGNLVVDSITVQQMELQI